MRIEIFDVGHGQCAVMTSPNGQRMMIDCGTRWGEQRFWTPSLHYFRTAFALLSVTNLDEDHLSDFAFMMQHCTIPWIASNPTAGSVPWAIRRITSPTTYGPCSRCSKRSRNIKRLRATLVCSRRY